MANEAAFYPLHPLPALAPSLKLLGSKCDATTKCLFRIFAIPPAQPSLSLFSLFPLGQFLLLPSRLHLVSAELVLKYIFYQLLLVDLPHGVAGDMRYHLEHLGDLVVG